MQTLTAMMASSTLFSFVILVIGLMIVNEFGQRVGRRAHENRAGSQDEATRLVIGSILGLLAFVLALTLSNASTRFSQRQDAALAEANAISTAWLQAGAAGGAQAEALQGRIADYIKVRYAFARAPADDAAIAEANDTTNSMQNDIWRDVTTVVQGGGDPRTASLMNAVNNMFDASTSMRYAMNYHMPAQILVLLFGMTAVAMFGIGYQFGQMGEMDRRPALVLAIVWSVVVVEIMDIGMSRIWSMTADVRTYEWTMQGMGIDPAAP